MTRARSSCDGTRTTATRSYSPATEYTSETPSMSAIAWAASGMLSISHPISTTALTIRSGPLQDNGHAHAARDTERGESQRRVALAQLVGARQDDARPRHADGVTESDRAAVHVQLLVVELQLTVAGEHLGREGLVHLDDVEVLQGEAGPV